MLQTCQLSRCWYQGSLHQTNSVNTALSRPDSQAVRIFFGAAQSKVNPKLCAVEAEQLSEVVRAFASAGTSAANALSAISKLLKAKIHAWSMTSSLVSCGCFHDNSLQAKELEFTDH